MGEPVKGTVTPLSSLFPVDEAQKALQRVHETIDERQNQLDQLNGFVADNKNLINLVQRLPDKLHHDIMVPFGKAAFFPGRLIHTNEFLVLLGEGYYADRTSKQTAEILTRRGKTLESQVQSIKAVMQDLKAEASFFDATAAESALHWSSNVLVKLLLYIVFTLIISSNVQQEGLVEIREDCVEETSYGESAASGKFSFDFNCYIGVPDVESCSSKAEDAKQEVDDEEYAYEPDETNLDRSIHQHALDKQIASLELHDLSNLTKGARSSITNSNEGGVTVSRNHSKDFSDQVQVEASNVRALSEDDYSQGECLAFRQPSSTDVTPRLPVVKDNIKAPVVSENKAVVNTTEQSFDVSKAFTGSIVEHSPNFDMQPREQPVGRASKPGFRVRMVECGRSMMVWVGFMCVILTALMWSSEGRPPRTFQAGGRDGWRLLPDDGLNRWAEKRRFRVNDTIAFEYEKGKDSVLVVRKRAYHHCNKTSPIHNMTDGFSTLKFTRNGPFYFISGYAQNCLNGQKLRPPPPPSSAGDGWITAPAPQNNSPSSPSSALISCGLTMAAAFLISLV
nr:RNA polymerase II subunit 5-mediating protein homolog isoform X1 [Ipomoea batatas]